MTDEHFIQICLESETMAKAAVKLGIHFNTFKRKAFEKQSGETSIGRI